MLIRRSSGTTDDDQTKLRKCEWVMNYEYLENANRYDERRLLQLR